jgi:predicted sugar kinase
VTVGPGIRVPFVETLTDTLIERVDKLVQASKEPVLSTTPASLAVQQLVARTEALETAVREIALEVHKLSALGS